MSWLEVLGILAIFIITIFVPFSALWVILEVRENGFRKLFKVKINNKWY